MQKKILKETGNYFSRSQLLILSELTTSSFETLVRNEVINKSEIAPSYELYEVVYFRIIKLLRNEFSMQDIREKILEACEDYEDDLLYSDYAIVSLDSGFPEKLVFCQIDDDDFKKNLKGKLMCVDRKTDYTVDGEKIHHYNVWINLLEVIADMVNRAVDYNFDNPDLKFAAFLNQDSSFTTV